MHSTELWVPTTLLVGWIYTLCWSASFYPQPLLNWQRKSTRGLAIDYLTINVLGFVCYLISTSALFFSALIRHQYTERHAAFSKPTVRSNDIAFAAHAVIMSTLTYTQFWPRIWGFRVYSCGHVKLLVTLVKYMPQVWVNYKRQSTDGWSIEQILLDFSGGVLSIVQLLIDASFQPDWSGVTGNPVKLGLGNITIFFDLIFITQHYLLYRHTGQGKVDESIGGTEQPLLANGPRP
ncbi:hypothetical protein EPUS_00915 [Endocarpon pusillum Z07020]|uniref:Cystinosin n=1 Tax=Endocarpon pusillum (strain Z07020 / HMAS-L-300199) TaxID=1263415 RepID=U1G8B4_ENDPU|nr:uncharacterized protein EPUS_00915 [Endocarpon pusillum Z07020]ERF73662.1 hypothetical protein EPUS_00915 [Endocarpon pusillum Z07020]